MNANQMDEARMAALGAEVFEAVRFLLDKGGLGAGALVVLGCSTSEIAGGHIGKSGSPELGKAIVRGAMDACHAAGAELAVQCCEHLNRALVLPRDTAAVRGYAPVSAIPYPHAGGSAASAYYRLLRDPVVVEAIAADAGLDIGDTLIGMHLKAVAVPLRPQSQMIGAAHLVMAFTRPKYIGGPRTQYTLEEKA